MLLASTSNAQENNHRAYEPKHRHREAQEKDGVQSTSPNCSGVLTHRCWRRRKYQLFRWLRLRKGVVVYPSGRHRSNLQQHPFASMMYALLNRCIAIVGASICSSIVCCVGNFLVLLLELVVAPYRPTFTLQLGKTSATSSQPINSEAKQG